MAAEIVGAFDDMGGRRESSIDIALFGGAFVHLVIADFGMQHRRVGIERG